eukprot:TRINITY_DN747_c0_g1_i4.p2 TRINITY_DN747_c0_g1~~TRINITY_DN747_c0_g1_i4.p2  ORF type:complete len:461 (+),score=188.05 TRINITY_DN747_c0_g1_i4:31-1383(+)
MAHRLAALAALAASASAAREWTFRGVHHTAELTQNSPTICEHNAKQFAGQLSIDSGKKQYFYWAFAARNASASGSAPTLLWMTGGPGCSSSTALFGENGPCSVNVNGDGTVNNPYSWNTFANIIFIDQPAGVGFSTGQMDDHDEAGVAEDMYQFLQAFFKEHGDWNTEFFAYGESYGGHYVPATAHRVFVGNQKGEGIKINLVGVSVGNGLTDPEVQYKYYGQMAYNWSITKQGHPTITLEQYSQMQAAIPGCISQIHKCNNGGSVSDCGDAQNTCNTAMLEPYQNTGLNPYDFRIKCAVPPLCYNFSNVDAYLNRADVQKQLGVSGKWQSCNFQVNQQFAGDWMKNYQTMIPDMLAAGIRVLIYAGDVDFICNWIGNKQWTLAMDWPGHEAFNAAQDTKWNVAGKPAGMIRTAQGFSFLQVFDAGHMVPKDQPAISLAMVDHFVHNKPF